MLEKLVSTAEIGLFENSKLENLDNIYKYDFIKNDNDIDIIEIFRDEDNKFDCDITIIVKIDSLKEPMGWLKLIEQITLDINVEIIILDKNFSKKIWETSKLFSSVNYIFLSEKIENKMIHGRYYTTVYDDDYFGESTLNNAINLLLQSSNIDYAFLPNNLGKELGNDKFQNYQHEFDNKICFSNEEKSIPTSLKGTFISSKYGYMDNLESLFIFLGSTVRSGVALSLNSGCYYDLHISDFEREYQVFAGKRRHIEVSKNVRNVILSLEEKMARWRGNFWSDNIDFISEIVDFQPYKFSIVIPVYNTESYLAEAIDSILFQDMATEYIEIILINDGSIDGSRNICLDYQEKYPQIVKFIDKMNEGVSKARNLGISQAKGKILNFLDSDDILDKTTLKNVFSFMDNHPEIDVSSIALFFFEGQTGEHPLNYKYESLISYVGDLREQYWLIQANISSAFIRREFIRNSRLDTSLKIGEDGKFIHDLLKVNPKIGFLAKSEAKYFYRKRLVGNSAMQSLRNLKDWYIFNLTEYHEHILSEGNNSYLFSQFMIMYDFQWRLKVNPKDYLDENEEYYKEYKKKIDHLLKLIDDEIITHPRITNLSKVYKAALLRRKNDSIYSIKKGKIIIDGFEVCPLKNIKPIISIAERDQKNLSLSIQIPNFELGKTGFKLLNGKKVLRPQKSYYQQDEFFIDERIIGIELRHYLIDVNTFTKLEMESLTNLSKEKARKGNFFQFSNTAVPRLVIDNKLVEFNNKSIFTVLKSTKKTKILIRRIIKMLFNKNHRKIAILRIYSYFLRVKYQNKKIWLISDRIDAANDNGEALFRYLMDEKENLESIYPLFIIDSKTNDYAMLKREYPKNVIPFSSKLHKILYTVADKLVVSHVDDIWLRPYEKRNDFYKDLFTFQTVFLQHGVTTENLSSWLKKTNKNIKLFITSSIDEQNSIVDKYPYLYGKKEVPVTGMARFDLLKNDIKDYITVMPTWRPNLVNMSLEQFKNSDYFKFYYSLLNDIELKKLLGNKKVRIKLAQHPNMKKFNSAFENIENVDVLESVDYKKIISESLLLITDRSSLFFDFGYLNKPVIYSHFDFEDLIEYAAYERGYFNYEDDGFGPVTYTLEDLQSKLNSIIENDFMMDQKYQNNIKRFFRHQDTNNRKRIIEEIKNMEENRAKEV